MTLWEALNDFIPDCSKFVLMSRRKSNNQTKDSSVDLIFPHVSGNWDTWRNDNEGFEMVVLSKNLVSKTYICLITGKYVFICDEYI